MTVGVAAVGLPIGKWTRSGQPLAQVWELERHLERQSRPHAVGWHWSGSVKKQQQLLLQQ